MPEKITLQDAFGNPYLVKKKVYVNLMIEAVIGDLKKAFVSKNSLERTRRDWEERLKIGVPLPIVRSYDYPNMIYKAIIEGAKQFGEGEDWQAYYRWDGFRKRWRFHMTADDDGRALYWDSLVSNGHLKGVDNTHKITTLRHPEIIQEIDWNTIKVVNASKYNPKA